MLDEEVYRLLLLEKAFEFMAIEHPNLPAGKWWSYIETTANKIDEFIKRTPNDKS